MIFNTMMLRSDPGLYAAAAGFGVALFMLIFSMRKYLELNNASRLEDIGESADMSLTSRTLNKHIVERQPKPEEKSEEQATVRITVPVQELPGPGPVENHSKAEEFVKMLYMKMDSFDSRLKNIEEDFSKVHVNREFTIKFLEEMTSDFDALDRGKIKARIEYLLTDLKK